MSLVVEWAATVPRSLSPKIFNAKQRKNSFNMTEDYSVMAVHPISSDLWEAITGERLSPENICQICQGSIGLGEQVSPINIHYIAMARDRHGSRMLQQKLTECTPQERKNITDSLLSKLDELVYDPCANYVIQKVIELTDDSEDQRQLLEFLLANVQTVIDHQNGCRVLQKFIEQTDAKNVEKIYLTLRERIVDLCSSANGNHIVQLFIDILPEYIPEMIEAIRPYVNFLVVDHCGCRVVQKLFDKVEISKLQSLVHEVLKIAPELAVNQYGNYVIQHILESGSNAEIVALFKAFEGRFYEFSMHKFASNVIEKCIRRANPAQKEALFSEEIGTDGDFHLDRILTLIGDQFGNYVIQRIIENGTESHLDAIANVVYNNYDDLIKRPYSKHVIMKLENLGFEF